MMTTTPTPKAQNRRQRAAQARAMTRRIREERRLAMAIKPQAGSIREYAVAAGVSVATVHRRVKSGEIASTLIGRRRIIPASEFELLRAGE